MPKFVTAAEAVECIKDNDTVAFSGFGANGSPETLLVALRERYENTSHPKNIRVMKGVAIGDFTGKGMSQLSKQDGLIGTMISAHIALEPDTLEAIDNNRMFAYTMPLGTVAQWFRSMVGKKPGHLTRVGLKTFADPRLGGGKGNKITREKGEDIVQLVNVGGEECLFYKYIPFNACIIRGTYADEDGNISIKGEAIIAHHFEIAAATRNAGGIVICQVNEVLQKGSFHPKDVAIQGSMVDYVVKADIEHTPHSLEFTHPTPELAGDYKVPVGSSFKPMPLDVRKICGRRAAFEIKKGAMANLGIGMPEAVGNVMTEEGQSQEYTMSIETGLFGGQNVIGPSFGAVRNPEVAMPADDILEWYDGGGLDMCCLGAAEFDQKGNVNASNFNGRCVGPGGFIDISQPTHKAVFLGSFTTKGLKLEVGEGKLKIAKEGEIKKIKKEVEQITFSAEYAVETGQDVTYITERAVFKLSPKGIVLVEIAPGMDLQKDILDQMEFEPIISPDLKTMDERIFWDRPMGLVVEG